MTKDKTYRYIEGCMYNYQANQRQASELEEQKKSLISVHGHNYEAHIKDGASNPVLDRTHKVLKIESRLKKLESYIRPVRNLHKDLQEVYTDKKQVLLILEKKYFKHEYQQRIQEDLHISQPTYWRRTQELMRLAKEYFALEE